MLRIAIIDPVGQKAGLDHYDLSLASALRNHSCAVRIYSNFIDELNKEEVIKQFAFSFGKNIFASSCLILNYLSALGKSKANKTEIIILHVFHSSRIDLTFIRLARIFGFRICLIVHDVESLVSGKIKSRINKCAKLADKLIVHNEFSFNELIEKIDVKYKSRVCIVPHGNFISLKKQAKRETTAGYFNFDSSKKHILFFGMIKKSKGLDVILDAMKNIDADSELIIAGRVRDVNFKEYQDRIDLLNLKSRIHPFIRYISNEERNMLFNFADVVVIPYRKIYQSGVLLLAMSYGIPVVVSNIPANEMMIVDNKTGIFFKDGNSSDLAEKINLILADEKKRKNIGESALEDVSVRHGWDKVGEGFYKILNG